MDDRIKELLKELGNAINDSISSSEAVNQQIQRIRDHGYNLYVFLDATIGLDREGEDSGNLEPQRSPEMAVVPRRARHEVQFRIDMKDLTFLRSVGIDPTRKVRSPKRVASDKPSEE
ncbi:MAG: hypothetical protein WBX15_05450 [Thermoanaerobaculia bacterium]